MNKQLSENAQICLVSMLKMAEYSPNPLERKAREEKFLFALQGLEKVGYDVERIYGLYGEYMRRMNQK